jgi:hypothetical protein
MDVKGTKILNLKRETEACAGNMRDFFCLHIKRKILKQGSKTGFARIKILQFFLPKRAGLSRYPVILRESPVCGF